MVESVYQRDWSPQVKKIKIVFAVIATTHSTSYHWKPPLTVAAVVVAVPEETFEALQV